MLKWITWVFSIGGVPYWKIYKTEFRRKFEEADKLVIFLFFFDLIFFFFDLIFTDFDADDRKLAATAARTRN